MDYERIYNQLIHSAKISKREGFVEKHHIVPRSHGGSDSSDNIVTLTVREHFVAHRLLAKIHKNCESMALAVYFMAGCSDLTTPSRTVELLKVNAFKARLKMAGYNEESFELRNDLVKSRSVATKCQMLSKKLGIKNKSLRQATLFVVYNLIESARTGLSVIYKRNTSRKYSFNRPTVYSVVQAIKLLELSGYLIDNSHPAKDHKVSTVTPTEKFIEEFSKYISGLIPLKVEKKDDKVVSQTEIMV